MSTANMPVPVKKSPPSHELFATYVKFIAGCLTGNSDGCRYHFAPVSERDLC